MKKYAKLEKGSGRKGLLLVLDSNQYIFTFGPRIESSCQELLKRIPYSAVASLRIPRLIVEEVRTNLTPEAFKEFLKFINLLTSIDENMVVPFEIAFKYEAKGFKPADTFIAAYAEWVGADILVTENRHFLAQHSDLPFRVLTAWQCLKLI